MGNAGQQTHFQAHQRQARKNSRRLTLAFLLGITLSALSYFLVTWVFMRHTGIGTWFSVVMAPATVDGGSTKGIHEINIGAIKVSAVIALISVAVILWGFFSKKADLQDENADDIAAGLGAQILPRQRSLRQQQYANVVEEMAIASGLQPPSILYLPHDQSINGFVTGGYDESVAIAVSQGALDYLNREELQALVAHEFGHIFNRDVFLNNRLTAVLHGFFVIKELMTDHDDDDYYGDRDDDAHFSVNRSLWGSSFRAGAESRFGIWGLAIIAISAGTIFFGKLLQAAFSRQREWLADAHAVQYTRNKDALVGVFAKAMALQYMQVATPQVADDSAHFLFINYHTKWLSTHPPMEERMARYGQKPFQDDLQALAYKMKQKKHDQAQAELKARQNVAPPKGMMTAGGTLLSLADDGSGEAHSATDDSAAQQRFISEKFIPLLALREYQKNLTQTPVASPDDAANAVLAQFVALGNVPLEKVAKAFKWSKTQTEAIQKHIESLNEQHPSTHIQTFLHQLPMLRQFSDKQRLAKQVRAIIQADKSFDLCEMSYLLCLRSALQKKPPETERQDDFKQHTDGIALLLAATAHISHADEKACATNYELMKSQAMPMLDTVYRAPTLDDTTVKRLYQAIQDAASIKAIYRKNLLSAIEKNMLLDGKLSTEQNHLLFALKRYW